MPASPLVRLRRLALSLPEAHEKVAWGEPTFRVRDKLFAMYASAESHHGRGRPAAWVKAAAGNQQAMIAHAPDRFFVPPYVGVSGWIGVWLDRPCDWSELESLLADGWRLVAPKRLVAAGGAAAPRTEEGRRRTGRAGKETSRRPPSATPRPRRRKG